MEARLLDRPDWGNTRRRGTDLVRVQQTRAFSKHGRDSNGRKQLPAIYLSELGPRRAVKQFKWFLSTIIVGVAGLAIIGIAIYASMHIGDGSGMISAMKRAGREAMKKKREQRRRFRKAGCCRPQDRPLGYFLERARNATPYI